VKVPFHIVQGRRERLARLLRANGYLPLVEVCQRLGVSQATARRDLVALAADKAIIRTYGGAISEYDEGFASFRDRQRSHRAAKMRIAQAALGLLKPGSTCFLDAGTTIHLLAEAIAEADIRPLTIVTNNLPVAEALSDAKGVEVDLVAGRYAARQRVLLGAKAQRSVTLWQFDAAFLSAEGMNEEGLWNSQADVVALQRAVAEMAPMVAFCIDASKVGERAPEFLLPWTCVHRLVTDATAAALRGARIPILKHKVLAA